MPISSLAGFVRADSGSTCGFHFDSSGAVLTAGGGAAGSTTVTVMAGNSSVTCTPVAGSTWNVRPLQSSASDLKVSAFLFDSTGNAVETSTFAASTKTSTARGVVVRQSAPDCTSVGGVVATAGDNTLLSSGTASIYCYALAVNGASNSTVTPTAASSAVILRVQNGTTSANLWRTTYYQSSANGFWDSWFVSPPQYLFKTGPGNPLNLHATATGASYALSAWRE